MDSMDSEMVASAASNAGCTCVLENIQAHLQVKLAAIAAIAAVVAAAGTTAFAGGFAGIAEQHTPGNRPGN
eukprot:1136191-Pelagomonas_calceolata.AAC.4